MEQQLKFEGETNDAGEPEGVWRAEFPDGSPQAEIHFHNGNRHGEVKSWYQDGTQASRESYHENVLHGPIEYFNESGQPTLSGEYHHGQKHGHWKLYMPSGKQTLDADYLYGKAHGLQRQYLPWRVEPVEQNYVHGVLVDRSMQRTLEPPRGWFYWMSMLCLVIAVGMVWFKAPMLIYAIMAFGVAVAVHETGHLIAARRVGIPIESFSIGVGWRLLSFYWGGTLIHLRLLPLMGYTEPYALRRGEFERWRQHENSGEAEAKRLPAIDPKTADRSADQWATWWRRAVYYLGGVAANFVLATGILWLGLWPEQPVRAVQASSQLCVVFWQAMPTALGELVRSSDEPPVEFDLFAGLTSAWRGPPLAPPPTEDDAQGGPEKPRPPQLPAVFLFAALNLLFVSFQLLPIPLLDGFRVVEATAEAIFRRPAPPMMKLILRIIGAISIGVILISLAIFAWPQLTAML